MWPHGATVRWTPKHGLRGQPGADVTGPGSRALCDPGKAVSGPGIPEEAWRAGALEVWLPTAGEMTELDRAAVRSGATGERTLIETAGREVARIVARRWPHGRVVGLLGSGHNGADALVALRTLRAWGREVEGVLCGSGSPEPDVSCGWDVPLSARERVEEAARGASVLLDGILGTGVRGAPRDPQAACIRIANRVPVPVLAVDGPSGVDFTSGAVPGEAIRAELTVSLGWPKLGLVRHPARGRCGELVCVEIGFPPVGQAEPPAVGARAVTGRWIRELLVRREPDAHKGTAGYLALVSGQPGMAGASVLAARSAGRGGAGVVRVVGSPRNRTIVQTAMPDAVFDPWDEEEAVRDAVEWSHAVAIGPGLGRGEERRRLVEEVLALRDSRPLLVDADAISVWAGEPDELAVALGEGPTLLTPHPGELARLMGTRVAEIAEDPPARAREAARRLGAVVLLKGAPSVVAAPDGALRVATTAGAEVAAGGSGDVLAGLAGAYLAAGLGPADAAASALFVSGVASSRSPLPEGHLAGDVPARLPRARADVERLPPTPPGPVLFALPPVRS